MEKFKILKGFILANGFEGKVSDEAVELDLTETEKESLIADGSIEAVAGTANNEGGGGEEGNKDETQEGDEAANDTAQA